jgi:hypothetical protein
MKTALVFTGLLRCWDLAYPSIEREILDKYEPDVFFDIWSEVGYYTGKAYQQAPTDQFVKLAEGDRGFYDAGPLVNSAELIDVYDPKVIRIEDFRRFESKADEFAAYAKNAFTRPKNTYSMFYKIARGMETLQTFGEYDLVIRMRPDLILNSALPDLDPKTFYTIRHGNRYGQGTGDGFQAGSPYNVGRFANYGFLNLREMYRRIGVSCPHLFTQQTISDYNLPWTELSVEFVTMHSPNGSYQEPT